MVEVGRNDECGCGSGQKFKHCCLRLEQGRPDRIGWIQSSQTLRDKNHALIAGAVDIFGLNRPWDVVKRRISPTPVKEFYQFVAALWPPSTDLSSLLPEPGSALRALYLGEYAPEVIIQNVCRFGLYADEIFLINPFDNPNLVADEYNPVFHPEEWIEETLRMLYQLRAMAPWVERGFVTFMPNPGDFDRSLFVKTMELAKERTKDQPITDRDIDESTIKQQTLRKFLALPPHYIAKKYREIEPNATDEEVAGLIQHVEEERKRDPFLMEGTMDELPGQFMTARTGANLEMGLYICQSMGAFPYTNIRYRWNEILSAREQFDPSMETWTPLTKAFQELDFKFLDRVDPQFAFEMRREQRLGGFRSYLRKVWNTVEGSPDPKKAESLARDFSDELTESYQAAKKEWSEIDIELMKWVGGGGIAAGVGGVALSALATGGLSLALPATGFAINGVSQLVISTMKRRNFRKTVPMSAFIDLERKSS
jgi:SEC-C motif